MKSRQRGWGARSQGPIGNLSSTDQEAGMAMDRDERAEQLVAMLSKGIAEPKITVVGCGGAGNNIVHGLYSENKGNVVTIAINTDERKLQEISAHKKLLIGKDVTMGKGAGGFPEVGEYCAECARPYVREALYGSDIVIIVAGMGGGTGTGVAPVVAQVSKELDAVTFAIAISPFSYEKERAHKAKEGILKLRKVVNDTIVLDNDRLMDIAGDMPLSESLAIMERSVGRIIDSLCAQITECFVSQVTPQVEEMVHHTEEESLVATLAPPTEDLALNASSLHVNRKTPEIQDNLLMR
ncbi:MAG: hypothetical protein QW520_06745 [Methanomassiliicoccales archaeon]